MQMRSVFTRILESKYLIPTCLVGSTLLRLIWILIFDPVPKADSYYFFSSAASIADGNGYMMFGRQTAYWPVGYPAVLGLTFYLFGKSLFAAKILNIVLNIGILFASYRLARLLFNSEQVARLTLLILAFYPNHIPYAAVLLTEPLFTFLLLSAMIFIINDAEKWNILFGGLFFGLAVLVKPQVIFLPVFLFLMGLKGYLSRGILRKQLMRYALVYLVAFTTLMPWLIRNYNLFGAFPVLANNGGVNLLIGNNPDTHGGFMDVRGAGYAELEEFYGGTPREEYEQDVANRKRAVNYMLENPGKTLLRMPIKFWKLYATGAEGAGTNLVGMEEGETTKRTFLRAYQYFSQLLYMVLMVLFIVSAISYLRKIKAHDRIDFKQRVGFWIIIYFSVIALIFFAGSRFHFPVIPFIVMFASKYISDRFYMERSVSGGINPPSPLSRRGR
ncbi:MAG: hypothetical protein GF315_03660 [candidate division Zixibacteria bacterium]|nr:hypothetical protein [candidate division Zixibacteria bacterium]